MKHHRLKRRLLSKMNIFDYNSMKLGHIITQVSEWPILLQELLPFVNDNSLFIRIWQ